MSNILFRIFPFLCTVTLLSALSLQEAKTLFSLEVLVEDGLPLSQEILFSAEMLLCVGFLAWILLLLMARASRPKGK